MLPSLPPAGGEPTAADRLLWALTGWRNASPDQFAQACDCLLPPAEDGKARFQRARVRSALYALGHTAGSGGVGPVCVLPPRLAELPSAGMPRAVLAGARGPGTPAALAEACAAAGATLASHAQPDPLAPTRLLVEAADRDQLRETAGRLGITHQPYPAAYAALSAAPALAGQLRPLPWPRRAEPSWPRRDFDMASRSFRPPGAADPGSWRLSAYTNPRDQQLLHLLWDGDTASEVDRSWGRLAALAAAGLAALDYDPDARTATAAATAPLPGVLERPLALCSGVLAAVGPDRRQQYFVVPPALAAAVIERSSIATVR